MVPHGTVEFRSHLKFGYPIHNGFFALTLIFKNIAVKYYSAQWLSSASLASLCHLWMSPVSVGSSYKFGIMVCLSVFFFTFSCSSSCSSHVNS